MRKLIILIGIIIIPFCACTKEIEGSVSDSLTYSEIYKKTESGYITTRTCYAADEKIAEIRWTWDEANQKEYYKTEGYVKDGVYIDKEDNKSFMTFKNGKLDGKFIKYYPTGELRDERVWQEGELVYRKRYYQNGNLQDYRVAHKGGYSQKDYREDGTLGRWTKREVTESPSSEAGIIKIHKTIEVKKFDKKGALIKE